MTNFINKLLNNFRTSELEDGQLAGDAGDAAVAATEAAEAGTPLAISDADVDLDGFVQHVVGSLVDDGAEWAVEAELDGDKLTMKIQCQEGQVGRIIGKNCKTIEAIRLLLRDAASRVGKKAKVVVIEGT